MALVYNCCFWFSLRLGGILIGLFSLVQGVVMLIEFCLANEYIQIFKNDISYLINSLDLIYVKDYLMNINEAPEKYITFGITISSIYIVVCLMFIYGAYLCNNILMICYIFLELLRLILLTILIVTGLLLLKLNTMDIGILIGASVGGGFLLLGMFYLWICAANLPIIINEIERDKQADAIATLQELLEISQSKNISNRVHGIDDYHRKMKGLFVISTSVVDETRKKRIPQQMSVIY